jgi:ankyrin repeat protein
VKVLIQHGAIVTARDTADSTPLHLASSKECSETVKLLLEHGADVGAKDRRHSTPLHLAASSRLAFEGNVIHVLLKHVLLDHNASVDAQDDRGQTPYDIAFSSGLSDITDLLSGYSVRRE